MFFLFFLFSLNFSFFLWLCFSFFFRLLFGFLFNFFSALNKTHWGLFLFLKFLGFFIHLKLQFFFFKFNLFGFHFNFSLLFSYSCYLQPFLLLGLFLGKNFCLKVFFMLHFNFVFDLSISFSFDSDLLELKLSVRILFFFLWLYVFFNLLLSLNLLSGLNQGFICSFINHFLLQFCLFMLQMLILLLYFLQGFDSACGLLLKLWSGVHKFSNFWVYLWFKF